MKKEETITEFHPRASAESAQVPATATAQLPPHHRLYRTRLWQIIHAGVGIRCSCESCWGTEDEKQISTPVADGSERVDVPAVLDEFLFVLTDYCRNEPSLTERLRTLRVARSGIVTAARIRERPGAEKKCTRRLSRGYGCGCHRHRIADYRHRIGA